MNIVQSHKKSEFHQVKHVYENYIIYVMQWS